MDLQAFHSAIKEKFPNLKCDLDPKDSQALIVSKDALPSLFAWLKSEKTTNMHYIEYMTAVDYPPDHLRLVYSLYSFEHKHRLILKMDIPRLNAQVPTVSDIWENADWNEREVFDLFGVKFSGHKNLSRLLMPEDWEGYPLLKDFTHPNLIRRPE